MHFCMNSFTEYFDKTFHNALDIDTTTALPFNRQWHYTSAHQSEKGASHMMGKKSTRNNIKLDPSFFSRKCTWPTNFSLC